jgi:hypothetical protein
LKKTISITLFALFLLGINSFAGNPVSSNSKNHPTNNEPSHKDTVKADISKALSVNDSLLRFPAYEIYADFDTSVIHVVEKMDFANYKDSIHILLNDPTY